MIDLILYDVAWRHRFISVVRCCVYTFLVSLFIMGFMVEREQNRTYTTGSYNDYISVYGEVGRNDINALKKELSKIPDWLMDEYVNDGGRVYLTSIPIREIQENYNEEYDGSYTVIGLHTVGNGIVKTWVYSTPQSIAAASLHEFGHYYDWYSDSISETEAFLAIYEHEKHSFFEIDGGKYHISTAQEYFASCFHWYLNSPRCLKRQCRQTYDFFSELFTSSKEGLA